MEREGLSVLLVLDPERDHVRVLALEKEAQEPWGGVGLVS